MKVNVQFINNRGMTNFMTAISKKLLLEWIKGLREGTEVHWLNKTEVLISQQYIK